MVYSSRISSFTPLSSNKVDLIEKASGLPHDKDGTDTDEGITKMIELFDANRADTPMMGIVFTDGNSKNPKRTAAVANMAKRRGIQMFSVGIGSEIKDTELMAIASLDEAGAAHVMRVDSFAELEAKIGNLVKLVCPGKTSIIHLLTEFEVSMCYVGPEDQTWVLSELESINVL